MRLIAAVTASVLFFAGAALAQTPAKTPAKVPVKPAITKAAYDGELSYIGGMQSYSTAYEDTFIDIARKNNLGFVELRAANPDIDPWMPGAGREIVLPTMHLLPNAPKEGIIINLPAMRLYHFPKGQPPQSYPIGIGRDGLLTPTGSTTIRTKKEGPSWRPTARMKTEDPTLPDVVPPGPENPLGTHMLYLGWPEYGIHGTNKPYGIGRRVSSGCIRMYPEAIIDLFPQVDIGAPVTIVNQPIKAAWIDNELFIEAHPTMKQADIMEADGGLPTYEVSTDELGVILQAAGEWHTAVDWQKVRRIIRERRGYPIAVAAKTVGAEDASGAAPVAVPETEESL